MSTTQPPVVNTQQLLNDLKSNAAPLPFRLWQFRRSVEHGQLPVVQAGRSTVFVPSAQQVQARHLLSSSEAVKLTLAAGEFWARTRVQGQPWSEQGIAAAEVSLTVVEGAQPEIWRHALPAVGFGVYQQSVREVVQTMATAPPDVLDRVQGQAETPFLHFAVALGMGREPSIWPASCLVVDAVSAVVSVAVHRLKFALRVPRPNDTLFNAGIQPLIQVPAYTAYPSGHASLCFALAEVLGLLSGANAMASATLQDLAAEIAVNRERAGLHTRLDTEAGMQLGRAIGQWMVAAADRPEVFGAWAALFATAAAEWNPATGASAS